MRFEIARLGPGVEMHVIGIEVEPNLILGAKICNAEIIKEVEDTTMPTLPMETINNEQHEEPKPMDIVQKETAVEPILASTEKITEPSVLAEQAPLVNMEITAERQREEQTIPQEKQRTQEEQQTPPPETKPRVRRFVKKIENIKLTAIET